MVCRPSDSWPSSCDTFGVLTADDRRVHWLVPHAPRSVRDALLRAIELETDDLPAMSTFMTAQAVGERFVWFGIGGGFPEGEGAFGGLLRFDRERRTVETITHPGLANASVSGLVIDGDALWVGTLHPGEYGPWGSTGILRRDLRNGSWTQLDSATTDLPDNLIQAIGGADGALYVATADGLAAFDAKSGRWNVRYFRRTIIADSIVYALATTRPIDEVGDEAMFVLMEQLGVRRREAFATAMRQIGLERLQRVLVPTGDTFAEALAHPALMPFLLEALAHPQATALAARALSRIGDRRAVPPLQHALKTAVGIPAGAPVAGALARLGDSTGLAWLHDRLGSRAPAHVRRDVLTALLAVRDTTSVGPILSLMARDDTPEDLRRAAVEVLRAYESAAVWRSMVDTASRVPPLRATVVGGADSIALSDSAVAIAIGDWAIAMLDNTPSGQLGYGAIQRAVRLRPRDAVRSLVHVVAVSESWGPLAAQELVRLTGVATAPAVDPWTPEGRRLAEEFWNGWWAANATRYRVVPADVGQRAYDAWFERVVRQREVERQRRRRDVRRGD
jgi:hypothetical protein